MVNFRCALYLIKYGTFIVTQAQKLIGLNRIQYGLFVNPPPDFVMKVITLISTKTKRKAWRVCYETNVIR